MISVQDIIAEMERIAPAWLAEDGDRIGLQVGSPGSEARTVCVCVDPSPKALGAALDRKAGLIIAHHPLIYHPLASLTGQDFVSAAVIRLVQAGAALFVAHTNLDSAPGGVNDCLAAALGLADTELMVPRRQEQFYKIAVFVPEEALEAVRNAMADAGAGVIGEYSHCSFRVSGTGSFLPSGKAKPYTGEPGRLEEVPELRLEMLCAGTRKDAVVEAMAAAHPYEEAAFDVYPLANEPVRYGFGRVGGLAEPVKLADFAERVRAALLPACLKVAGDPERMVKRVAALGGGGSQAYTDALRCGADVYVTGDTRHHDVLAAEAEGMAVIDAGHFETERPGMLDLARRLKDRFSGHGIDVAYVE